MDMCELINGLKDVKLVIGNGFDLYRVMLTKYSDFFKTNEEKYNNIHTWLEKFKGVNGYTFLVEDCHLTVWRELEDFDDITAWDVLFCIISSRISHNPTEQWRWCDVEQEMAKWLSKNDEVNIKGTTIRNPNWKTIFNLIQYRKNVPEDWAYALVAFILKKHDSKIFNSEKEFYKFLLDQLKEFEIKFGEYIYNISKKPKFSAKTAIKKICNVKNIVSIDTFNYDELNCKDLDKIVNHINGDYRLPIFGIDSDLFNHNDPQYIFTKTYRRMTSDTVSSNEEIGFKNLVVFGHSLNEEDYSYFFSIFDRMGISDVNSNSKVVFAYSIYDDNKRKEIKSEQVINISRLFQTYSMYKSANGNTSRLLERLTSQGRILLHEVNNLC